MVTLEKSRKIGFAEKDYTIFFDIKDRHIFKGDFLR
jgi:hypothetical protein